MDRVTLEIDGAQYQYKLWNLRHVSHFFDTALTTTPKKTRYDLTGMVKDAATLERVLRLVTMILGDGIRDDHLDEFGQAIFDIYDAVLSLEITSLASLCARYIRGIIGRIDSDADIERCVRALSYSDLETRALQILHAALFEYDADDNGAVMYLYRNYGNPTIRRLVSRLFHSNIIAMRTTNRFTEYIEHDYGQIYDMIVDDSKTTTVITRYHKAFTVVTDNTLLIAFRYECGTNAVDIPAFTAVHTDSVDRSTFTVLFHDVSFTESYIMNADDDNSQNINVYGEQDEPKNSLRVNLNALAERPDRLTGYIALQFIFAADNHKKLCAQLGINAEFRSAEELFFGYPYGII